jgi:molybdopterin synthase catalytic subunit
MPVASSPENAVNAPRLKVCIQTEPFDPGQALHALRCNQSGELDPSIGAVASFIGLVREFNEGDDVTTLELEHYPGMTEKVIEGILDQALERWPLYAVHVVHRVGPLAPTDLIVWVGAASAHREAALQACAFVMDFLKTNAPFWKKERKADGKARWVSDRASDYLAADRWKT